MSVRDNSWYNANSTRLWPFDDSALLTDDAERDIPTDFLVDLNLRFPSSYGERAYVGALFAGPAAVSVLILSDQGKLLASFTGIRSETEAGRVYPLVPQLGGVGGWVVFGEYIQTSQVVNLKFSESEQSLLLTGSARRYSAAPVLSLGKLHASESLTGLIRLVSGNDVRAYRETLVIDGQSRQAIVFDLENKEDDVSRNLLQLYSGPCSGRPESNTCDGPAPIEVVNTVRPDCCGNLFLEFRGCADISSVQNDTMGVIIDCGFGLSDACISSSGLPDSSGRLPIEFDDLCEGDHSEPTTTVTSTTPTPSSVPQDHTPQVGLPWSESFDDQVVDDLTIYAGSFTLVSGGQGSGEGLAGTLDIIIPNLPSLTTCTVVFDGPHGLAIGESFLVIGNEVAVYNNIHTVQSIDGPNMLVSNIPYTTDGDAGLWARAAGALVQNSGGAILGSVTSITKDTGSSATIVSLGESHNLVVGDDISVSNSPISAYNVVHAVTQIIDATTVKTDQTWSVDALGGFYVSQVTGGAGRVTSVANDPSTGRCRITLAAAHGLDAGDEFIIGGNSASAYNTKHVVSSAPSSTIVVTDVNFDVTGTGGSWYLVSDDSPPGYAYQGETAVRNISLWTDGLPQQVDWRSWFIEIETILCLTTGATGVRHNGGIVFNYRASTVGATVDYFLAEINWDTARTLRLWAVRDGAFELVSTVPTPALTLDQRYRLQVKVLPWAPGDTGAYVVVLLTGLDSALEASIGPIRISSFTPVTGKIGLHCNQSPTRFDILTVRDAGF